MATTSTHTLTPPSTAPAPQPQEPHPPPSPPNPFTTAPTTPDESAAQKAACIALFDTAIAASRAFGAVLDRYISLRNAGETAAALALCNDCLEAPYQAFLGAMRDLGVPVGAERSAGAVSDDGSEDGSEIDWGFGERGVGLERRGGGAGGSSPEDGSGTGGGGLALGVGGGAPGDGVSAVVQKSGKVKQL